MTNMFSAKDEKAVAGAVAAITGQPTAPLTFNDREAMLAGTAPAVATMPATPAAPPPRRLGIFRDTRGSISVSYSPSAVAASIRDEIPFADWLDRQTAKKLVEQEAIVSGEQAKILKLQATIAVNRAKLRAPDFACAQSAATMALEMSAAEIELRARKTAVEEFYRREVRPVLVAPFARLLALVEERAIESYRQQVEAEAKFSRRPASKPGVFNLGLEASAWQFAAERVRGLPNPAAHWSVANPKKQIGLLADWQKVEELAKGKGK